jgi:hypothetical protein
MFMEEEEANNIRCQTERPYDHNETRVGNFWGGEEALQGFHRNREAKRKEENPINKSSKNFSSVPAIRISGITSTGTFV